MKKKILKVPFNLDGDMLSYDRGYDVVWKDNFEFIDTLKFIDAHRGRSSVLFKFKSSKTHKQYVMFLIDMKTLLSCGMLALGFVNNHWTFCKRGAYYGIRPVFHVEN